MNEVPEMPQVEESTFDVINPRQADALVFRAQQWRKDHAETTPIRNGEPMAANIREQPVHRVMCLMALAGVSNKDIAVETGYSPITVASVLKQPWAKTFMAEEAKRVAGDGLERFLKGASLESARLLVELRDDPAVSPKTRADICNSILDRALGKPTVRVESESHITHEQASLEASRIDDELKSLREQLGEPTHGNS